MINVAHKREEEKALALKDAGIRWWFWPFSIQSIMIQKMLMEEENREEDVNKWRDEGGEMAEEIDFRFSLKLS